MFSNSHMLNVHGHGHGWWGSRDACGALGMVRAQCVGALSRQRCAGGHWAHKSMCGRRVCLPACAKPVFSDINMCCERAHL